MYSGYEFLVRKVYCKYPIYQCCPLCLGFSGSCYHDDQPIFTERTTEELGGARAAVTLRVRPVRPARAVPPWILGPGASLARSGVPALPGSIIAPLALSPPICTRATSLQLGYLDLELSGLQSVLLPQ